MTNQNPIDDENKPTSSSNDPDQNKSALNNGQSRPSIDNFSKKNNLSSNIEPLAPRSNVSNSNLLSSESESEAIKSDSQLTNFSIEEKIEEKNEKDSNIESNESPLENVDKNLKTNKLQNDNLDPSDLLLSDKNLGEKLIADSQKKSKQTSEQNAFINKDQQSQKDSQSNLEFDSGFDNASDLEFDVESIVQSDKTIDPKSGLSVALTKMIEEDVARMEEYVKRSGKNLHPWKLLTQLSKSDLRSSHFRKAFNKYFHLYTEALKVAKRSWRKTLYANLPATFVACFSFPLVCLASRYIITHPEEIVAKGLQGEWEGLNYVLHKPEPLKLKTCRLTGFLNKMDWNHHRRINYYPGSIFIVCRPELRLSNDRFFLAEFKSTLPKTKHTLAAKQVPRQHYVISSRQYNMLVPNSFLYYNVIYDKLNESQNCYGLIDQTQLGRLQYWQQHHVQLDTIPIKTSHQFPKASPKQKSYPLFKHVYNHQKVTSTKKRFRFLFFKRGCAKIVLHKKPINPYIRQLSDALIQTSGQPKLSLKPRPHEQPYLNQLRDALIENSPFSKEKFRGQHRRYQYQLSNSLRVLREVINMHVHTSPMMLVDDQHIDVQYFFRRRFIISRCLSELTDYKPRNYSPYELNNNLIEYRLRHLLHEDVGRFNDQEARPTDRMKNPFDKDKKPKHKNKNKLNPFSSLYLSRKEKRTSQPNPFDFLRGKERAFDFYRMRSSHKVLPHFQTGFNEYMQHQLDQYGLKPDKCHLTFPVRNPFETSYELKGVRIRRRKVKNIKTLRNDVLESESPLLKRKFSGYQFPDSDFETLFSHQARWKNRFFIKDSGFDDDVFIMVSGPEPDIQWLYRSLMNIQKNQTKTVPSYEFDTGRLLEKGDNFYGQLEPDVGPIYRDKETKKPPRYLPTDKKWPGSMREPVIEPELFEQKRKLVFDPSDPFGPKNVDEAKKGKHPTDTSWHEEPMLFMENQRCLPIPLPRNERVKHERVEHERLKHELKSLERVEREFPRPMTPTISEMQREHSPLHQIEPSYKLYSIPRVQELGSQNKGYLVWKGSHNMTKSFFKFSWPAEFKDFNLYDWVVHYENYFGGSLCLPTKISVYTISQYLLAYYVFKYFRDVYNDYRDDFWEGLELFFLYLDLEDLLTFKSLSTFVTPPGDITFRDVMGGQYLLDEFYPIILFLRSRRQMFSSINLKSRYTPSRLKFSLNHMFNYEAYEKTKANPKPDDLIPYQKTYYKSNMLPKGFLLIGSPGTGKTFLVKALSGETQCPVISNSNEKYVESPDKPGMDEGFAFSFKLRKLFKAAKLRAPSILFIDELDSVGSRRELVLTGPNNAGIVPGFIYSRNMFVRKNAFSRWVRDTLMPKTDLSHQSVEYASVFKQKVSNSMFQVRTPLQRFDIKRDILYGNKTARDYLIPKRKPAHLLETTTVLLCELDGIESHPDVIVIGATNRPEVIDPAVIRPGRLGKIIYLDLPNKQRRFDLLKFYGGEHFDQSVDWDYFSSYSQTGGLSSAHFKCIMNASSLRLISLAFKNNQPLPSKRGLNPFAKKQGLLHTNATIQYGIEATRYQNLHAREARRRFIKRLSWLACDLNSFYVHCQPNSSFFLTEHVETHDKLYPSYIITNIEGIHLAPFQNNLPPTAVTLPVKQKPNAESPSTSNKTITGKTGLGVESKEAFDFEVKRIAAEIYSKHYKTLRLRYLCTEKKRLFFNNLTNVDLPENTAVGLERFEQLIKSPKDKQTWRLFKGYVDRVWRVDVFGMKLLMDSPYALNNPFNFSLFPIFAKKQNQCMKSNFQWATFPQRNLILSQLIMRADKPSFLKPIDHTLIEIQEHMFGDGIAILRSAYYTAGKALIIGLLDNDTMFDALPLSLWSHIRGFEETRFNQQRFIHGLARRLITKPQFEKYLLALVAGKMSEKFLLLQDPQNESNIGMSELQQMNWLANVMVEKGLLYTTAPLSHHQTIIQEDYHPLTAKKALKDGSRNKPKSKLSIQNDVGINRYWWSKKYIKQANNDIKQNFHWPTQFFDPEDDPYKVKQYETPFVKSIHETNTVSETHTQTQFKHPNIPSEPGQPLNQSRLTAILNSADVQWNDFVRSDNQDVVSHLIFDACGKAFNVLIRNRPLLDLLVYELLVNHQITGRDAKKLADKFLCKQTYSEKPGILNRLGAIYNKMLNMADLFNFICCSHLFFGWCIKHNLIFPLFYYELMTNTITATEEEIEQVLHLDDESASSDLESIDIELFSDGTSDYEPSYGPEEWDEIDEFDVDDDQLMLFYDGTLYYEPSFVFGTFDEWYHEQTIVDTEKSKTIDVLAVLKNNKKTIEADLDYINQIMKQEEKYDQSQENKIQEK